MLAQLYTTDGRSLLTEVVDAEAVAAFQRRIKPIFASASPDYEAFADSMRRFLESFGHDPFVECIFSFLENAGGSAFLFELLMVEGSGFLQTLTAHARDYRAFIGLLAHQAYISKQRTDLAAAHLALFVILSEALAEPPEAAIEIFGDCFYRTVGRCAAQRSKKAQVPIEASTSL